MNYKTKIQYRILTKQKNSLITLIMLTKVKDDFKKRRQINIINNGKYPYFLILQRLNT